VLNRQRSGEKPTFSKKEYGLDLGGEGPTVAVKCQVEAAGGPIDAFQLATDCVAAWDGFLSGEGLN
jgi:hypothetical protein